MIRPGLWFCILGALNHEWSKRGEVTLTLVKVLHFGLSSNPAQFLPYLLSMWNHWTARTCHPHQPFLDFEFARWFWIRIITLFPDVIAAVEMPNHIHLILPQNSPRALRKLTGLLGAASKKLAQKQLWQPISKPSEIPDRFHLQRQVRYVALNPCRKGLCRDPMEWYFSTYRELLGAAIGHERVLLNLQSALGDSRADFQVRFHAYVSGDPSVHVAGTPFPRPSQPKEWAYVSVGEILSASAAVLRLLPDHVSRPGPLRHLFIHAAYRHGWDRPQILARICGIRPNSVHWFLKKRIPDGLANVDLCLGDSRLRRSFAQSELE